MLAKTLNALIFMRLIYFVYLWALFFPSLKKVDAFINI
jgi:hypothetical protein